MVFDFKTKSQFRSACKSQREICSYKVGRLLWSLGERKCGKRGGLYKEKGKCNIKSRIEFTVPKLVSLDTPHGPITMILKNVRKMWEK